MSASNRDNKFIWHPSTSCGPDCPLIPITYVENIDQDEVGEAICNNGAFSGRKCGVIEITNYTFDYNGTLLLRQRRASYSRLSGDSGGPVVGAANYTAAGSHTHYQTISGVQHAIYSQVAEMEQKTGMTVYTGGP